MNQKFVQTYFIFFSGGRGSNSKPILYKQTYFILIITIMLCNLSLKKMLCNLSYLVFDSNKKFVYLFIYLFDLIIAVEVGKCCVGILLHFLSPCYKILRKYYLTQIHLHKLYKYLLLTY